MPVFNPIISLDPTMRKIRNAVLPHYAHYKLPPCFPIMRTYMTPSKPHYAHLKQRKSLGEPDFPILLFKCFPMDAGRIPFLFGFQIMGRIAKRKHPVRLDGIGQVEIPAQPVDPVRFGIATQPHAA